MHTVGSETRVRRAEADTTDHGRGPQRSRNPDVYGLRLHGRVPQFLVDAPESEFHHSPRICKAGSGTRTWIRIGSVSGRTSQGRSSGRSPSPVRTDADRPA